MNGSRSLLLDLLGIASGDVTASRAGRVAAGLSLAVGVVVIAVGVFTIAGVVLGTVGLNRAARYADGLIDVELWVGLFVLGAMMAGATAADDGRRNIGIPRLGRALGCGLLPGGVAFVLFVWEGVPWIRALGATVLLVATVVVVFFVAFERARLRRQSSDR